MMTVLLCLIAVLALEAAIMAGFFIWREFKSEFKGPKGGIAGEDGEDDDMERRWQRGFDAMMRYNLDAARKAAGKREDR